MLGSDILERKKTRSGHGKRQKQARGNVDVVEGKNITKQRWTLKEAMCGETSSEQKDMGTDLPKYKEGVLVSTKAV